MVSSPFRAYFKSNTDNHKVTKVVGPVNNKFKASLSVSGTNNGSYSASYEGTIEILKDGEKLIGSSSNAGNGYINITCDIND